VSYELTNKVVIVTGASSGIGQSCVERFVKEGAKVVLAARNIDAMKAFTASMNQEQILIVPTDVSKVDQVDQLVKQSIQHFGQIDILINNAGVGIKGSVVTSPLDEYEKVWRTNVNGVLYGIRSVYPLMKKQGSGIIVNVSSVAGFKGFHDSGMYSSTKFAVNGMTESLAEEARKDNIDVILVCPGKVETNFEENVVYREEAMQTRRTGVSADSIAVAILQAIQKRKRMIVVGKKCKPLYLLNRVSPNLTNIIIRRIY